jgi:hypothetical protein
VHLRTESAVTIASFTRDADLAVDPALLPDAPPLEEVMTAAGFRRDPEEVGRWTRSTTVGNQEIPVEVDLLVPEAVAPGSGRRSVDLTGHDRLAVRRTRGLEAVLVEHSAMVVRAVEAQDVRALTIEVAGPAALLVAKLHKIAERYESGRHARLPVDKDAADVYRLFQAVPVHAMADGLRRALTEPVSRKVTETALDNLQRLFGGERSPGIEMTKRGFGVSGDAPETTAAVIVAYVSGLRRTL